MSRPRSTHLVRALAFGALGPLVACGEPTAVGALSLKHGPPFDGVLTAASTAPRHQWVIERASTGEPCDDVVHFGAHDGWTAVLHADGTRASVADLAVGRRVSVWFGPVMLASCPGQTSAERIVLH